MVWCNFVDIGMWLGVVDLLLLITDTSGGRSAGRSGSRHM